MDGQNDVDDEYSHNICIKLDTYKFDNNVFT